jgi:hypothetical protein
MGESRAISRTLIPSFSKDEVALKDGEAIPVRVMAVYVRFDEDPLVGSSSSVGNTLSMPTRLVPLSILMVDDEDGVCVLGGHTLVKNCSLGK